MPSILLRHSRSLAPALALATLLLAACGGGDGPTGSGGGNPQLQVVSGDGQRGLNGVYLAQSLVVRAVRPDGTPAAGATVSFATGAGSGTLDAATGIADGEGRVSTRWRLGTGQQQTASVSVEGGAAVTFGAELMHPSEADLVLARGHGGRTVRLAAYDGAAMDELTAFRETFTDSVHLIPFAPGARRNEVFALAAGHPPVRVTGVAWTPGRDTVVLDFQPPVRIAITVWIVKGPFPAKEQLARLHASTARDLWSQHAMAVEFSEVQVIDATGDPDAASYHGASGCGGDLRTSIGYVSGRINVYYVGALTGGYAGFACNTSFVMMAEHSGNWPRLLAHEIGHTFGLQHVTGTDNFMNPNPGPLATAGQAFRAHFDVFSSLNSVYGAYPESMRRNCIGLPGALLCPSATWVMN